MRALDSFILRMHNSTVSARPRSMSSRAPEHKLMVAEQGASDAIAEIPRVRLERKGTGVQLPQASS
jgi:hypothetical protein